MTCAICSIRWALPTRSTGWEIPEAYRVIVRSENLDATMPFGVDAFIAKMESYVPGSTPSMRKFFDLAEEVRLAQAYTSAQNGKADPKVMVSQYGNFVRSGSYSVNEVLKTLKMPQKAIDILSAYWCYLGANLNDMSFVHYASMVNRYIRRGASMPKMRSHEISLALVSRILELGGEVLFNTEAVKILQDEKDGGVRRRRAGRRHADRNPPRRGKLRASPRVRQDDGQSVRKRRPRQPTRASLRAGDSPCSSASTAPRTSWAWKTITISCTIPADTVKQYDLMRSIRTNTAQATVCLNRAYPECSPKGTCMMYFTTLYMSDDWGNVKAEDYFKTKDMVANMFIDRFEKDTGAKIRDSIEEISVATPVTYARYCGHPQGVIYGYESSTGTA